MKILISAAEASSDQHGAQLLQALRKVAAEEGLGDVSAFGVGGPRLQAVGLRPVVDARDLLAMGFTEILGRLPRILCAIRRVADEALRERPDAIVVIDYPDFHFRLAKRLRSSGIPLIYYIPPKVWAWRKGRVDTLRERFARILSILPFEEEFYRREQVPARYVGNPLVDELPLHLTRNEARGRLSIGMEDTVLLLMPGSRPSELRHHLELMLDAALGVARELGQPLVTLLPFAMTADLDSMKNRVKEWQRARAPDGSHWLDLRLSHGDAPLGMLAADAGLIKSGTSTLEAGLLGCVHAIVYQSSWFSHFVFHRVVRRKFKGPVGLVNLVHGWKEGEPWLIREFLEHGTRPDELEREIVSLIRDRSRRARIETGLASLKEAILGGACGRSPSEQAAREVLAVVRESASQVRAQRMTAREGVPE